MMSPHGLNLVIVVSAFLMLASRGKFVHSFTGAEVYNLPAMDAVQGTQTMEAPPTKTPDNSMQEVMDRQVGSRLQYAH